MVAAAFPESCWYTMARARAAKYGIVAGGSMRQAPTRSITRASTGSTERRWAMARRCMGG
jgi:hypothetical protein